MPALKNQRQEMFCQLVKRGVPPFRAYPEAGYQVHHSNAYRLREKEGPKRRIAELNRGMAMKTQVTVASISDQLDEDRAFAQLVEQAGPALNATIAKAKLHGLVVDRKESGGPGDFAQQSAAEVLELVRRELGDDTAAALAKALAAQDEPAKAIEAAPEPTPTTPPRAPGDTLN